jgi:hypothetical protein
MSNNSSNSRPLNYENDTIATTESALLVAALLTRRMSIGKPKTEQEPLPIRQPRKRM